MKAALQMGEELNDYGRSLSRLSFSSEFGEGDLTLLPEVLYNCFRAGTNVELIIDYSQMTANRFDADEQRLGNLFVAKSFRKVGENLFLSSRQACRLVDG